MRRAFFMWCVPYCKRRHIASRKAMYCTLKGGLLHCERPPFAIPLIFRLLYAGRMLCRVAL